MMKNHVSTRDLDKELRNSEDGFRMKYRCFSCGWYGILSGSHPHSCPKCHKEHVLHCVQAYR